MMLTTLKVDSDDLKKVALKIRTAEGVHGNLIVYIMPKPESEKAISEGQSWDTCAMMEIPLKPLNLHERIQDIPKELTESLPFSKIAIKGKFSQEIGLQWICNCLPNVPSVVGDAATQDGTIRFFFKSSFTKTYLIMEVSDGLICAYSDNFSVITIVKD